MSLFKKNMAEKIKEDYTMIAGLQTKNKYQYMSHHDLVSLCQYLEDKVLGYLMSLDDYEEALDQIKNVIKFINKSTMGKCIDQINNIIYEVQPNE